MQQLVIATSSEHKLSEIAAMLQGTNIQLLSLRDFLPVEEPEEDGATMADNARLKAIYYARVTGMPTLADDSGLEVDALNSEPGVRSARWVEGSDADRIAALLARLKEVPTAQRTARYRCTLCLVDPIQPGHDPDSPQPIFECEGTCEGVIAEAPRGQHGFGYDPVFEITAATDTSSELIDKTVGELEPEIKAQLSHRARAVQQLTRWLKHSKL